MDCSVHLRVHFCIGLASINQRNQGEPLCLAPASRMSECEKEICIQICSSDQLTKILVVDQPFSVKWPLLAQPMVSHKPIPCCLILFMITFLQASVFVSTRWFVCLCIPLLQCCCRYVSWFIQTQAIYSGFERRHSFVFHPAIADITN